MQLDDAVGVLDIGSSKVACLILQAADADESGAPRVAGIGHQRSRGMKAGFIADLEEAAQAVEAAVGQAERMAGTRLGQVLLGVSCGRLRSQTFCGRAVLEDRLVAEQDLSRLDRLAREFAQRDGGALVWMNRTSCRINDEPVEDPHGRAGRALAADFHAVTADEPPVRSLLQLLERCGLAAHGLVPCGYASALAATAEEERSAGIVSIDVGAGTTAIAAFGAGHFLFADSIPVGGNHLTYDISRALGCSLADAERIKTLYGTMVSSVSDEREVIGYQVSGESAPALHHATKARLAEIVRHRIGALLQLVRERLEGGGVRRYGAERIVITGGTSQLPGMERFAAEVLGVPVRVRRPVPLPGMPGSVFSPAFSTAIGLALATRGTEFEPRAGIEPQSAGVAG